MKAFVQDPGPLIAIAKSWIGTPFAIRSRVKGPRGGVDCVCLGAAILVEAGFPGNVDGLPIYRADFGHHSQTSALQEWFDASPDFARLVNDPDEDDLAPFLAGDMALIRAGRVAHHLVVMIGLHEFVHSFVGKGVSAGSLRDVTYAKRLVAVYRPIVKD